MRSGEHRACVLVESVTSKWILLMLNKRIPRDAPLAHRQPFAARSKLIAPARCAGDQPNRAIVRSALTSSLAFHRHRRLPPPMQCSLLLVTPTIKRLLASAVLFIAAVAVSYRANAAEQTAADEPISPAAKLSAASFRVEPGYQVTPVASEPLFANPVAFCFDPQGRIFVAETHRVHHGTEDNRNHMDWLDDDLAAQTVAQRRAYIERRMADKLNHYTEASDLVRLLEDRNRDGVYDHSSVFSEGYNNIESGAAAGVMWVGDRLWFTCIPDLWELRDADGDGQAEERKSLATGFGVHFALFGHDLHGLTEGPDGKIYFSIGDRGLHVETPNGVLSNPDSGSVLRCNRDGSDLELFATGLRNPQELAFNQYGDLFSVDNNSDSGDRAHIIQIVEGMNTGWRMSYQYLPDRGPFNREKIWHTKNADQPAGIVPPIGTSATVPRAWSTTLAPA